MKKLMLALVVMIVLVLSGCDSFTVKDQLDIWEDEDRLEFIDGLRECYNSEFDEDWCYEIDDARYYTQEEVVKLIDDECVTIDTLKYVTNRNVSMYIEQLTLLREQINELDDAFVDYGLDINSPQDFVNLVDDLEDEIALLEQRIIELENGEIE